MTEVSEKVAAPHGRDAAGTPLAPYGLKVDGHPRTSRRGAQPGQRGNGGSTARKGVAGPPKITNNATDAQRRSMLIDLVDNVVVVPLVVAGEAPFVTKRLGRHAENLPGHAVLIHSVMPSIADGLVLMSHSNPGMLSWLEGTMKKAPWLIVGQTFMVLTKAVIQHAMTPDPALNAAGRTLLRINTARMAEMIEQEAAEMGLTAEDVAPAA
jgi:hypothetical protein